MNVLQLICVFLLLLLAFTPSPAPPLKLGIGLVMYRGVAIVKREEGEWS